MKHPNFKGVSGTPIEKDPADSKKNYILLGDPDPDHKPGDLVPVILQRSVDGIWMRVYDFTNKEVGKLIVTIPARTFEKMTTKGKKGQLFWCVPGMVFGKLML